MSMIFYYFVLGLIPTSIVGGIMIYNRRKSIKRKALNYLFNIVIEIGKRYYGSENSAEIKGRYIIIPYKYNGMDYIIYVPYSRSVRRRMINSKVSLITENGDIQEIPQQPGCQYLVNADMLGGVAIKVYDFEEDTEIIYGKNEIPVLM